MSLDSITDTLVKKAFDITDSFMEDITYQKNNISSYDPVSDTATNTITSYNLRGLLTKIQEDELQYIGPPTGEYSYETRKLILATKNLPVNVVPSIEDTVIIKAELWEIFKVQTIPGESIYKLFISRAG